MADEKKIFYGSWDELDREELCNPKHFEGGKPPLDISALAKELKEKDPDGKITDAIAEKYRK